MDSTEAAQSSDSYGQRPTVNTSSLPLDWQYGDSISCSIPSMSQQHDHPESQHLGFGTIVQPPDQASRTPFQSDLSQGAGLLVRSPQGQQYRSNQHSQMYPLTPSNSTSIGSSGYLESHQRYSETNSNNFTGVEGSTQCKNLYQDNPALSHMSDLGPQKNQGTEVQHRWPAPMDMHQRNAMLDPEEFQQQNRSDATSERSLIPHGMNTYTPL